MLYNFVMKQGGLELTIYGRDHHFAKIED